LKSQKNKGPKRSVCHLKKHLRNVPFMMLAICVPFLAGCEVELTGAKARDVVALAEPTMDSLLMGLAAGDYAEFSSEFDTTMQDSIPSRCFEEWRDGIEFKLGSYLSRRVHRVARSDEFYVIDYLASFEADDSVLVGFAFHSADPHTISHFWIEADDIRTDPEPRRECELQQGGA
jgi:hypothetical protein